MISVLGIVWIRTHYPALRFEWPFHCSYEHLYPGTCILAVVTYMALSIHVVEKMTLCRDVVNKYDVM